MKKTKLEKELAKAIQLVPKIVIQNKTENLKKQRFADKVFGALARKVHQQTQEEMGKKATIESTQHPWRLCPPGQHWVRTHTMHTKSGEETTRNEHCAANPSKKDQLYPEEMNEMAARHFPKAKLASASKIKFDKGDQFDKILNGWTKYWNDVLKPTPPLDPNLVKALVASESSFKPDAKQMASKNNFARGLMQVTDETRKILRDEKGELKNHFVNIGEDDSFNPNLNVAAGVRWLHHKKRLAGIRLKRAATWEEAVEEYKAILSKRLKGQKYNRDIMERFSELWKRLSD